MTKEEFETAGYTTETLPSGNINIISKTPFHHNGGHTIACFGGRYMKTTSYKSMTALLDDIRELREAPVAWKRRDPNANENDSHGRSYVNSEAPIKRKTKKVTETHQDEPVVVTDQDLTAFLVSDKPKIRKTRKTKGT